MYRTNCVSMLGGLIRTNTNVFRIPDTVLPTVDGCCRLSSIWNNSGDEKLPSPVHH